MSVRMSIRGRGKIGYLTGKKKAPTADDAAYATWDAENSMVMAWLVNSMDEDIASNYMNYQRDDNVTKYFHMLKRLLQDLDLFNTYEWKSPEDYIHHRKMVENDRVFKFLVGLKVEFDEVRGRIIGRGSLPSLEEVFAEVRQEESRRSVMLGKKGIAAPIENSALLTADANLSKSMNN